MDDDDDDFSRGICLFHLDHFKLAPLNVYHITGIELRGEQKLGGEG